MTCWWHKWSEWKAIENFIGEYVFGGGRVHVIIQSRSCCKCGKIEINRQEA